MTCHLLEPQEPGMLLAAGLWEQHEEHGFCYTMVMTEADPESMLGKIHNRMPVILTPEDGDHWLAAPLDDLQPSTGVALKQRVVQSPLKKAKPPAVKDASLAEAAQGDLF